jgi:hypothetical protein
MEGYQYFADSLQLGVLFDTVERQIANRNRSPSARTNSHLLSTHRYQLTTARCIVAQGRS